MCQFHPIQVIIHCCHMILFLMITMSAPFRVCIWVPHVYKLRFLECSWSPLTFTIQIVVEFIMLLSYAITKLHAMDAKMSKNFLMGKWKWILYVINAQVFFLVYVMKAFITLNQKYQYKYLSSFSSTSTHTFPLYKLLVYRSFNFIVMHARHVDFQ